MSGFHQVGHTVGVLEVGVAVEEEFLILITFQIYPEVTSIVQAISPHSTVQLCF